MADLRIAFLLCCLVGGIGGSRQHGTKRSLEPCTDNLASIACSTAIDAELLRRIVGGSSVLSPNAVQLKRTSSALQTSTASVHGVVHAHTQSMLDATACRRQKTRKTMTSLRTLHTCHSRWPCTWTALIKDGPWRMVGPENSAPVLDKVRRLHTCD